MTVEPGGSPGVLRCPRCGRRLSGEDAVYTDETLRLVGCEYCVLCLPAAEEVGSVHPPYGRNRGGSGR